MTDPAAAAKPASPPVLTLGLVMAGAVSAGAYTAGVMDFLAEALNAMDAARKAGRPLHQVRIEVVTGASAGAMTAAMLAARAEELGARAPHTTPSTLHEAWVKDIHWDKLLTTRDLDHAPGHPVASLLDGTSLREIADKVISTAPAGGSRAPSWLANPLPLMLTVTNLRGIPYKLPLRSGHGADHHRWQRHNDHVTFWRQFGSETHATATPTASHQLPDERSAAAWSLLAQCAIASGAFPIGLPSVRLQQPRHHYVGRNLVWQTSDVNIHLEPTLPEGDVHFVAVDGGTVNNEPMQLAWQYLFNGLPETPKDHQALIVIDPFPSETKDSPAGNLEAPLSLAGTASALLGALLQHGRFSPEDLPLILASDRLFLVSPSRDPLPDETSTVRGSRAIACGALGGFSGFLSLDFREHDYQLGRRNCQRFLERHFVLPRSHALFAGWRDSPDADALTVGGAQSMLPIIPLFGALHPVAQPVQLLPWPIDAFIPLTAERALKHRLNAIFLRSVSKSSWGRRHLAKAAWGAFGRRIILSEVMKTLRQHLHQHRLLSEARRDD